MGKNGMSKYVISTVEVTKRVYLVEAYSQSEALDKNIEGIFKVYSEITYKRKFTKLKKRLITVIEQLESTQLKLETSKKIVFELKI